eukprot:6141097-Pyramimonas_sp.AAC.1
MLPLARAHRWDVVHLTLLPALPNHCLLTAHMQLECVHALRSHATRATYSADRSFGARASHFAVSSSAR